MNEPYKTTSLISGSRDPKLGAVWTDTSTDGILTMTFAVYATLSVRLKEFL